MEETLLSVGIDTGAASPQTGQPVWGPHVMLTSSAEVNSACGKCFAPQNIFARHLAHPVCDGSQILPSQIIS